MTRETLLLFLSLSMFSLLYSAISQQYCSLSPRRLSPPSQVQSTPGLVLFNIHDHFWLVSRIHNKSTQQLPTTSKFMISIAPDALNTLCTTSDPTSPKFSCFLMMFIGIWIIEAISVDGLTLKYPRPWHEPVRPRFFPLAADHQTAAGMKVYILYLDDICCCARLPHTLFALSLLLCYQNSNPNQQYQNQSSQQNASIQEEVRERRVVQGARGEVGVREEGAGQNMDHATEGKTEG